ncbi:hypothetical protein GCM10009347_26780 [Shewanella algicola]|uniref:TraC family protein n=1 Tax=Shewanella algicola TaxID=640633 RepID=UPI0016679F3C|nr:TraC family protein [Shewanella algicola]GGP59015.1 hypothetical protein GCM10009347_26780 [Shewanella algicola]
MGVFSSYFNKIRKLADYDKVDEMFGFVGFETDYYIMEGGGMAVMFCCQPTPGCNEELKNTWDAIFKKDFPADTTIQAQLVGLPDISYFINQFETTRGNRLMGNDNELTTRWPSH